MLDSNPNNIIGKAYIDKGLNVEFIDKKYNDLQVYLDVIFLENGIRKCLAISASKYPVNNKKDVDE